MITYVAEWDPRLSCWSGTRLVDGMSSTLAYKCLSPAGALTGIKILLATGGAA